LLSCAIKHQLTTLLLDDSCSVQVLRFHYAFSFYNYISAILVLWFVPSA